MYKILLAKLKNNIYKEHGINDFNLKNDTFTSEMFFSSSTLVLMQTIGNGASLQPIGYDFKFYKL